MSRSDKPRPENALWFDGKATLTSTHLQITFLRDVSLHNLDLVELPGNLGLNALEEEMKSLQIGGAAEADPDGGGMRGGASGKPGSPQCGHSHLRISRS